MATFQQKTKYYLWCNAEDLARYTPFRTDAEGEPTICPVCSSSNIDEITIKKQINRGMGSGENEAEWSMTSTTPVSRAKCSYAGMAIGEKVKVVWYCELFKNNVGNAQCRIKATGAVTDVLIAQRDEIAGDTWIPFGGEYVFEADTAEDIDFDVMFNSGSNGKQVSIRRARIWTEELPEGT